MRHRWGGRAAATTTRDYTGRDLVRHSTVHTGGSVFYIGVGIMGRAYQGMSSCTRASDILGRGGGVGVEVVLAGH